MSDQPQPAEAQAMDGVHLEWSHRYHLGDRKRHPANHHFSTTEEALTFITKESPHWVGSTCGPPDVHGCRVSYGSSLTWWIVPSPIPVPEAKASLQEPAQPQPSVEQEWTFDKDKRLGLSLCRGWEGLLYAYGGEDSDLPEDVKADILLRLNSYRPLLEALKETAASLDWVRQCMPNSNDAMAEEEFVSNRAKKVIAAAEPTP